MAVDSQSPFIQQPWRQQRTRSGFGRQAQSTKQNAASFTLGLGREARDKLFLSNAHTAIDRRCREGPGHIYDLPGSFDRQADARKQSASTFTFSHSERLKPTLSSTPAPGVYQSAGSMGEQTLSSRASPQRVRFGTGTRDQATKLFLSTEHVSIQRGVSGSPPGSYDVPGALGQQVSSAVPSSPAYSLPRTDRLKDRYEQLSKTIPAAGQYETWNSIGKQSLSLSRTMPAYGFGSSDRDKESARFLTSGHAKSLRGTFSPSNYDHQQAGNLTSFGKQSLTAKQNQPSYGFGTQARLVFKSSTTPGPGAYD